MAVYCGWLDRISVPNIAPVLGQTIPTPEPVVNSLYQSRQILVNRYRSELAYTLTIDISTLNVSKPCILFEEQLQETLMSC
jgi:hypothetical protein